MRDLRRWSQSNCEPHEGIFKPTPLSWLGGKIAPPRTLRHGQCLLRRAAESRTVFSQGDARPLFAPVADYLLDIAIHYPEAATIHLVLDNLNTHTRKAVVGRFGEKAGNWLWERFTTHYTPKHGSWLNQADIAITLFSRQCLGRRRIGDRASLRRQIRAWSRRMNHSCIPTQWNFTRNKTRDTFEYTIMRSRH